jgi:guanyl-specific ribonuclease Sa
VAGTLVLTPTGYRAIETLQVGELVLASDPETGVVKECQILQTFERQAPVLLDIQVGHETITCTPEHPFWVPEQGWTQAGKLQVGTSLLTSEGNIISVTAIKRRAGRFEVYNFEVEEFHTYFVSSLSTLVHNADCGSSGLPKATKDSLPLEAADTLNLIDQGGPFPYIRDGITFRNREGRLPSKPIGYYKEYTVVTPGATNRGARRIVTGEGGEIYYTDDHYSTFREVE